MQATNNPPSKQEIKKHYETWFRIAGVKMHPGAKRIAISDLVNMRKKTLATFDVEKDRVIYLSNYAIQTFYHIEG